MSELRKIAESLRHCAVGIGHCRECLAYGEKRCSELLKQTAADAIEQLLEENSGPARASAPTERNGGPARASAPTKRSGGALWKTLHVGERVWFLWFNDDVCEWEIGQELVTGVGYKGFWYSGSLDDPLSAEAFVGWDRVNVDVFFSAEAAEDRRREANE